ncbi:MAG: malto-oligosyltrehalose trehalohydrolase [Solirubrobacteraceae bacterium]
MSEPLPWELPLGSRVLDQEQTEFRVWSPSATTITLSVAGRGVVLREIGHGVHEVVTTARPGDDYWYEVDGRRLPDPCSRWQPQGLRGPSRVLATTQPAPFERPAAADLIIYELHVGTFSAEGTFDGAIAHLPELAALGVTAIELMPVAEFPGARGWGYDGVYLGAAQSSYGGPDGLQRLIEAVHAAGLAVILDVVYNHVGASGSKALEAFGPYFTSKYETPWGKAINYDDPDCDPVREWVCQSAEGWIREFGVDGLRLDAIHAIFDSSAEHIVAAVARRVHALDERAYVIAESGLNDPIVMRGRARGGYNCDAAWSDDFHHSLRAVLTGDRDGYYADFGRLSQLAKAIHRPHVDDGGYSPFRRRRFGAPADDVPVQKFVVYCQNHDQVGNRAFGDRMPAQARPLAAFCTLLSPFVPLLFLGEEYGELAPFQFFSNHIDEEIAVATREGRRREFASFVSFEHQPPDPEDPATFERSKLTRRSDTEIARLYARLIEARKRLAPGDATAIAYDESERWLRFRRGAHAVVCNFGTGWLRLECEGGAIELATDDWAILSEGYLKLPPMSGALIR